MIAPKPSISGILFMIALGVIVAVLVYWAQVTGNF